MSHTDIGKALGGRDHSTITYGIKEIEKKYEEDASLKSCIDVILKLVSI